MSRLLLYSNKKFLCPYSRKILIEYPNNSKQPLQEWLMSNFHVNLLNATPIPESDVRFVTVMDKQSHFPGEAISFARASNLLEDEPVVIEYLKAARKTIEVQLQYGILGDKLVSIEDIPKEKYGLRCGCVCPGCGGALVARLKGENRRKHFGHRSSSVCDIAYAQQTALHMIAKEIIEEEKIFAFPNYSVSLADIPRCERFYPRYNLPESMEYRKAYTVKCTSVVLEKKVSDFVPDIVVDIQGRTCLIEIAVTHFVDEVKQQKINKAGLPVLEVDLSAFIGQQITRDIVRDALISQTANKKWLYNPLKEEAVTWATAEYNKLYEAALEQAETARKERQKQIEKEERKEKMREKKREETAFLLQDLFEPENYKYELQHLRSDDKFQAVLRNLHLWKDIEGDIPFFLDIPITGEMVFACDRRIWQAAVFDTFIYYRKMDEFENVYITINKIQTCLRDHMDYVQVDWKLVSSVTTEINGRTQKFALFYDVVRQYLDYLHYIGFIGRLYYGKASVARIKTIVPPNEENAKRLKTAIESVDQFAPDVDEQIDRILNPPRPPRILHRRPSFTMPPPRAANVEDTETSTTNPYVEGRLQAWAYDFDSDEPFYDSFGYLWLKCANCGALKRDDEVIDRGGKWGMTKGLCRDCSRPKN